MNIRRIMVTAALPLAIALGGAAATAIPKKPPAEVLLPPPNITVGSTQTKGAPGQKTMPRQKEDALKGPQATWAPSTLWYWWNGGYQQASMGICSVNAQPQLRFYIQHFECGSDHCLGGFGPNPYRWTLALRRNGANIWSVVTQTSSGWINIPVTLSTPLQSGSYDATVKLEKRNAPFIWSTQFNQTTTAINFTGAAGQSGQAPIPVIRLEVVANAGSDVIYQLRGWQTNGNASLVGQWEIYDSDPSGAQYGQEYLGWAAPGATLTMNKNLNLGSWYMLKYGNYSQCYSWNETRRLVYIKK
jgi:hypothetical protein